MQELGGLSALAELLVAYLIICSDFVNTLITFPKPIVAAVNGPAVGLGMAILALCDVVYASDKASFSCLYTRLRQTPEACASYTLPKILGSAMVRRFFYRMVYDDVVLCLNS